MKKKDLLQKWKIVQEEYYKKFNHSEIEEKYSDWFYNDEKTLHYMEKSKMIEELIKDEFRQREIDDTIEELKEAIAYIMKKKDLLQDWKIVQEEYYEQFNRSEIEEKYSDWFYNDVDVIEKTLHYMEKSKMIEELIKDELRQREDDTIEELKEAIAYIEKLNFNN